MALLTISAGRSDNQDPALLLTSRPGFGLMVRSDLLKRDLEQCIRRTFPAHERVEEGEMTSLLEIAARAHLAPLYDPCRVAVNVVVYGNLLGNSIRSVEGVNAYTRERSRFMINLELFLDQHGASLGGVGVSMPIHSELLDIRTARPTIFEPTIQTLGEIRFEMGQQKDDQRLTEEGEKRVRRDIYKQARQPLCQANKWYREEFLKNLADLGIKCDDLGFYSTPDFIWLTARNKNLILPPPPPVPDSPLVLQLHPGMLNYVASEQLAGKTYTEEELEKLTADLGRYIQLPQLEKQEDRPLKVKMASKDPLTLKVDGEDLVLTIAGESYTVGEDTYPGMNVTARYRIVRQGAEYHLIRDADVDPLPPDFKPGMRLGARQQVLRTILRRRFGRLLPSDIPLRDLSLRDFVPENLGGQEGLSIGGTLRIERLETTGGWLTVGVRYRPEHTGHSLPRPGHPVQDRLDLERLQLRSQR
jgi:hypothetical protein